MTMSILIRLLFVICSLFCLTVPASESTFPEQRKDIQEFIQAMVKKHHFEAKELEQLFHQVQLKPRIVSTIKNPKEKETWGHYRKLFLQDKRIQEGAQFFQQHEKTLNQAEQEFGVPKDVILGILGVETFYGSRQGKHRVIDALATLAFNYKSRAKFFRSELEAFLILTRKYHIEPLSMNGSYAGAMGYPQFMPSSYLNYALDYSNTGHADLLNDPIDAIGSVANYLAKRGHWQKDQPILEKLDQEKPENLSLGNHPMKLLYQYGLKTKTVVPGNVIVRLFEVKEDNKTSLYIGYPNFKAIMSYNPRINYAMAVYHLAEAVGQERKLASSKALSSSLATAP